MQQAQTSIKEQEVLNHLKRFCQGPSKGISAPELAALFKTSERQMRALLAHLVIDRHLPVCSTPSESFFWPQKRQDTDHTFKSLISRHDAIQKRLDAFNEAVNIQFGAPRLF